MLWAGSIGWMGVGVVGRVYWTDGCKCCGQGLLDGCVEVLWAGSIGWMYVGIVGRVYYMDGCRCSGQCLLDGCGCGLGKQVGLFCVYVWW